MLLDCVTRIERRVDGRLPGRAARRRAARARASSTRRSRQRPLQLGLAHSPGSPAWRATSGACEPGFVVAWGARAVLAAALDAAGRGSRSTTTCSRAARPRGACRRATKRRRRRRRRLAGDRATRSAATSRSCTPASTSSASRPRPLPDGPPQALVLGALVEWKRPELALEIAARLPELQAHDRRRARCPATTARSSGACERTPARRDDRRPVADVPQALAEHHVLLHCADAEPYGMVLVEALAAGPPGRRARRRRAAGDRRRDGPPLPARRRGRGRRSARARCSPTPTRPPRARRRAEAHFDVRDSTRRLEAAIDAGRA